MTGNAGFHPCVSPFHRSKFCQNKGICLQVFFGRRSVSPPFCRCARGFVGLQCEKLFDSDPYGFIVSDDLENKALSTVVVILSLMVFGFILCLVLHRRFVTAADRESNTINNNSNAMNL